MSETILQEADRLTGEGGDRNDGYDHPRRNFDRIAKGWEQLFGVPVSTRQVALAMIWVKCVRENHSAKRDNLVDIAGYARCIERLGEPEFFVIDECSTIDPDAWERVTRRMG